MIALIVTTVLAIVVILTGAVLHYFMPESQLPMVIIGIAVATLVPAIVSMARALSSATDRANRERKRAEELFEETQVLKGTATKKPKPK